MLANDLIKDGAAGGVTTIGGILLYVSEHPQLGTVLFIVSLVPIMVRLYHAHLKRKEEHERHEKEMKLMDLERKIKEKEL